MSEFRRRLLMVADKSIDTNNYLTVVAREDGLTAKLSTNACEYCVDGNGNWKSLPADTETEAVNSGQTLSFRANLIPAEENGVGTFTINKLHNLKGDCMSLLFGDDTKDCFSLADNDHAFRNLFNGNNRLIDASELSLKALDLGTHCYYGMFGNCTNLINVPELPSVALNNACYAYMFQNCTSLIEAPALPAIELVNSCYAYMFKGCTSLTKAPVLSATTLAVSCYRNMFENCTSLTKAPQEIAVKEFPAASCTDMFNGCTSLTKAPILSLTITKDNAQLLNFCFERMFKGCKKLLEVQEKLPQAVLSMGCCTDMFNGCTSLTKAPALPATKLTNGCYQKMFYGCTSLTDAPELPATTIAQGCYAGMFQGCTSLIEAPDLPAKTLAQSCYSTMFKGCESLTKAPIMSAETLADNCCQQMFAGCTSLETAPELNALTLTTYCYEFMFHNCSKLNYIKMMAIDINAPSCVSNWVVGVGNMGTFVKNKDATWNIQGISGIPNGWTVITE